MFVDAARLPPLIRAEQEDVPRRRLEELWEAVRKDVELARRRRACVARRERDDVVVVDRTTKP